MMGLFLLSMDLVARMLIVVGILMLGMMLKITTNKGGLVEKYNDNWSINF